MNIGKYIYKKISDLTITGFTSTNIFPNIIETGVEFPAIVYEITDQKPNDAKNTASKGDIFSINLYIFSNNYDLCIDISDAIRDEIDNLHHDTAVISESESITIDSCVFIASHQSFDEASKVHTVIDTYSIRTKL